MSIRCPDCQAGALSFVARLEVPPDGRWDEIGFCVYDCRCGFRGVAVSCEERRGRLDTETVETYGLRLDDAHAQVLLELIRRCPDPSDRRCRCEAHLALGRQEKGEWAGLDAWGAHDPFRIERIRS